MSKIKIDVSKLEKLVSPEILSQIIEDCEKPSRLVERYGEKLSLKLLSDENFVKSLLSHSIILSNGRDIFSLPLSVDGKELKLYYRKLK
jgi:hypothetical protein